jgi:hypothetical protein
MNRGLAWTCALFVCAGLFPGPSTAAPLRVLSSTEREVVVEWTGSATEWEELPGTGKSFRRPLVPGGAYFAPAGEPDLPAVVHMVAIPKNGTPSVQVLEIVSEAEPVADLAPAPDESITFDEMDRVQVHSERSALRPASGAMTPGTWAEISGITHVRGNRLARLVLHPCRYDVARGELHSARRLVVRVDLGGSAGESRTPSPPEAKEWQDALRGMVLNPQTAGTFRSVERMPIARGAGDSFASSPVWLKVRLDRGGFYPIDYFTFTNLGFDPGTIDPASVRVFSGRFLQLAESLQTPRDPFMIEHALLDLTDGDAVFETGDRLLFHALGATGWSGEYDPTLSRTLHNENQYTDETVVWITWGGSFSSPPRRMASRSVAPDSTAAEFSNVAPHRVHFEQNNFDNFRFRDEDGWWWESLRGRGENRRYDLKLEGVANGNGRVKVRLGSVEGDDDARFRRVQLKLGQVVIADSTWIHSSQTALVEMDAQSSGDLYEGTNAVTLNVVEQSTPVPTGDQVQVAWFEIEYQRTLAASSGRTLHFFADSARGVEDHLLTGFQGDANSIFFFDVTDPHAPVRLANFTLTESAPPHGIRFSDPITNGATRWYFATTMEGVLALPPAEVATFRGLRSPANGGEYLVVYHPRFERVAQRLAEIRATDPSHPRSVKLVSIDDIYDEFAWGMEDPTAIRDFFAYATQQWDDDAPIYATLVGDAAYDQKKHLAGSPDNLMPSYLNRYKESTVRISPIENTTFYSTDDFYGYLEPSDYQEFTQPGLDLAIGRYPITDEQTMDLMLDKLESYLDRTQPGSWQNRAILVADDERTLDEFSAEQFHTLQVEELDKGGWMPPSLDLVKIYLTEYPRNPFGKKPEAQAKFIEEFTRGALLVSYTGHGDQNTMAQEEVFVSQKVPELLNEEKYAIFSTFSCTVSRFDLLSGSSMCELLLHHEGGGSVTTFASGSLVFPNPSAILHQRWIGAMFGTPYVADTFGHAVMPLGMAALIAKVITGPEARTNNEKYVILGDPALEPRFGKMSVVFDPGTVEQQATDGLVRVIRGSVVDSHGDVLDGTHGLPPFNGKGFVYVTENADTSGYPYEYQLIQNGVIVTYQDSIPYILDGPIAYRGEVPVTNGRFEAKFFLSDAIPSGNMARVSVFALEDDRGRDASGAFDKLVIAPTISPDQVSDAIGPSIGIAFEGFESFQEGDFLKTDRPVALISLEDPSGINLRRFPQFARLEMEIDGSQRLDLAEDFSYAEGSFTQGAVRRILSLGPGEHTVEVKAFDNVGNRSATQTRFTIVLGEADFDLVDAQITPYPNPFMDEVDFIFRLTRDADVSLKVFTINGRRIFLDDAIAGREGENVYHWNGRDDGGGLLANGTYLYKLDAAFRNTDGSLKRDEFVGRVVKMR